MSIHLAVALTPAALTVLVVGSIVLLVIARGNVRRLRFGLSGPDIDARLDAECQPQDGPEEARRPQ